MHNKINETQKTLKVHKIEGFSKYHNFLKWKELEHGELIVLDWAGLVLTEKS